MIQMYFLLVMAMKAAILVTAGVINHANETVLIAQAKAKARSNKRTQQINTNIEKGVGYLVKTLTE